MHSNAAADEALDAMWGPPTVTTWAPLVAALAQMGVPTAHVEWGDGWLIPAWVLDYVVADAELEVADRLRLLRAALRVHGTVTVVGVFALGGAEGLDELGRAARAA